MNNWSKLIELEKKAQGRKSWVGSKARCSKKVKVREEYKKQLREG